MPHCDAGRPRPLPTGPLVFGSNLNLNVHCHLVVMDGAFIDPGVEKTTDPPSCPLVEPQAIEELLPHAGLWQPSVCRSPLMDSCAAGCRAPGARHSVVR